MIRLYSKVDSLRKIMLYPLPTKPVDVAVMVRVERTAVAVSSAGRIYTSQVDRRGGFLRGKGLAQTLACLKKLGILTSAAIAEHQKLEAEETRQSQRRSSSRWILDEAASAGLKLSPKQRTQLQSQCAEEA